MKRPPECNTCEIGQFTEGFTQLDLGTGDTLHVGEAAGAEEALSGHCFVGGSGAWRQSMLRAAHQSSKAISICNVLPCRPHNNVFPLDEKWNHTDRGTARRAVERCKELFLYPRIEQLKPKKIVALGNEALKALTTREGILQWRGSPLQYKKALDKPPIVIGTLHPSFIMRTANMFSVAVMDFKKSTWVPPEHYNLYPTIQEVRAYKAPLCSFDFEWSSDLEVTMCGFSNELYHSIVVPWCEPFITECKRIIEEAEILIGHNLISAEMLFIDKWGWKPKGKLIDTLLLHHLIAPDFKHGLDSVASVFSFKVFWKGKGEETEDEAGNVLPTGAQWKTWDSPDAIPREYGGYGGCRSSDEAYRLYNARDTDGTLQCYEPLLRKLREYNQEHIYWNVSVPAAYICRDLNSTGMRINPERVGEIRRELEKDIGDVEKQLPEGLAPYELAITRTIAAATGTYKPKLLRCKGSKKAGTSHDVVEWSVSRPGIGLCLTCGSKRDVRLTEIKRIKIPSTKRIVPWNSTAKVMAYAKGLGLKDVAHIKTGNATGDKRARKIWSQELSKRGDDHKSDFTMVDALKILNTQKNGFAKEALQDIDRVFFRLMVWGTSEGRLACKGAPPANINLQNTPPIIRHIFIPDQPGWGILNQDIEQGENMLTAWLARDWERWERLNTPGYSEHCVMGEAFFNTAITKKHPLYKPAKIVNHSRNYGSGPKQLVALLNKEGYFQYGERDVKEFIEIWKKMNPRTFEWQKETTQLAKRQSYLVNPYGRRRSFSSRDFANKALAFLPASTLADAMLRIMVALYPERFAKEIEALKIRVVGGFPAEWRLMVQVHDSLASTGPHETHMDTARMIKRVAEQPWEELKCEGAPAGFEGGFRFKLSSEYSTVSWGDVEGIEVGAV